MLEAFVLTRSFRDRRGGVELEYWASTPRGPLRVSIPGQRPLFFVEREAPARASERKPLELSSLSGAPVDGLYFESQTALAAERDRLLQQGLSPLEADLRPADRYLMERFITGAMAVEGELTDRGGYLEVSRPTLRQSDYTPALRVLSLDLETDDMDGPILSAACSSAEAERVFVVGEPVPAEHAEAVPDERALLQRLFAWIGEQDPDVIIGWNVIDFDLVQLQRRAAEHGVPLSLGRGGQSASLLAPRGRQQSWVARVPGRVVLDGITTARAATYSFESFALDDVAQTLLGRGKLVSGESRADEIRRMFDEDREALVAYNLEDCRLVREIFDRADLLGFAVERQQLTGLAMERGGGAVAAFDNLYLPRLHRRGFVAPTTGQSTDVTPSPGGYVMESVPGLFDDVVVLDFKSLYPSIIRTFAIDPLGLALAGDDAIEGFAEGRFDRHEHILPGLIEELWAARERAKARGDGARSQAIKILMNSFYGVLGTPACRFFDHRLASSITLRGHQILTETRDRVEQAGYRVIYGDTDSIFVLLAGGRSEAACRELGAELAESLNAYWAERLVREHGVDSRLELEFETHYLRFLMPTMRRSERGSKKRYAGCARNASGELEVVFKGMEAVRTDWTPLAREFQRELYRRIFAGEPYEDYVQRVAADLSAGKLDDRLVYRKRLRKPPEEYVKAVPPHVQAARKLERPGRQVSYYMTVNGPEPVELRESSLDYEHYLEKQLAPAADGILQFLGTDFMRLGGRQLSLF